MQFQIALEIIREHCRDSGSQLADHPEIDAIITHWLQKPAMAPIYGDKEIGRKWANKLAVIIAEESNHMWEPVDDDRLSVDFSRVPFPPVADPSFSFIDLFAGIGGFRLALQSLGGKCVFSSEWDRGAKSTYFRNFGEIPFGDISQFTNPDVSDNHLENLIPEHDVLVAGFPCQPFSLAGVSARQFLGKNTGFACEVQGTCFWDIVRVAKVKKPKVLILENVKNLKSHDGGNTLRTIQNVIEDELNYSFKIEVVNSNTLVPQNRERCYMVCFREKSLEFEFPLFEGQPLPLSSILEKSELVKKYSISEKLWLGHVRRTERNLARGTGFTAYQADISRPANTLVARYGKDGKECLIPQAEGTPRMLSPRECARLQGFPESFIPSDSRTPAYKQFGNAVSVPVVRRIAEAALRQSKLIDISAAELSAN